MPQPIDLSRRGQPASPMSTPPPAQPIQPPTRVNAPPLNVGQVVSARGNSAPPQTLALQPQTQAPTVLPPNVRAMQAAIQQTDSTHLDVLPLDYKPRIAETVAIEQLAPAEQAHYRQIANNVRQEQGQAPPPPNVGKLLQQPPAATRQAATPLPTLGSQRVIGARPVEQPGYPAPPPNLQHPAPPQQQPLVLDNEVEMDMPVQPVNAVEATPVQAPAPTPPQPVDAGLQTFADPTQLNEACNHCGWPQNVPDIPEPSMLERQAFLQSILGQIPFIQDYTLLGGNLRIRFRTLTSREVDVIYAQAAFDRSSGKLRSVEDYYEAINRYRLYLQLQLLDAGAAFVHDLPDGLSKDTNPQATATWTLPITDNPANPGLDSIAEHMANILNSEMLVRVVSNTCSRFNRLVAKLEAMTDNQDFWKPIGVQS